MKLSDSPLTVQRSLNAVDAVTVIVWDVSPSPSLLAAIEGVGAHPEFVCQREELDLVRCSSQCNVALVAIGVRGEARAATLETIKRLKAKGFEVLGYGPDVTCWPLGDRCRALLAGCESIFDSSLDTFIHQLIEAIRHLILAARVRTHEDQELKELMRSRGIVGESPSMLAVFRQALRISPFSDLSMLITGETGTGKELIARACHALDPKRNRGPFVAVNCSAISVTVAESELFGHRRGAFTGAERDRKGLIRAAHGGVLFLDEVGELAASTQSKLLRVLQDGRVRAVGDEDETPVSVRIVAATNTDIRSLIERKRFRSDLFYRLNVLPIHLPPLRERREDIGPLVEHFAVTHATLNARAASTATREFVEALCALDLPGNVRQLENIVRWALVHNDGEPLSLRDLPPEVLEGLVLERNGSPAPASQVASVASIMPESMRDHRIELPAPEWNLARSLHDHERLLLERALRASEGNHSRAARLLGITPRSVYNMVRRHRVS